MADRSNKKCVSRRHFKIHIRERKGITIASAAVSLNKKLIRVFKRNSFKGKRHQADIDLRGLPKGRFVVKIVVIATTGKVIQGKRVYHTCEGKRRKKKRPGPL